MSADAFRYTAIMLVVGVGIPLMAALTTQLGKGIDSPAAASTTMFAAAFLAAAITMMLTTGAQPLRLSSSQPLFIPAAGCLWFFICFRSPRAF